MNERDVINQFKDKARNIFSSFIVNSYFDRWGVGRNVNQSIWLHMRDHFHLHIQDQLAGDVEYIKTFLPDTDIHIMISEIYSDEISKHANHILN